MKRHVFGAIKFIFEFLKEEEGVSLRKSLENMGAPLAMAFSSEDQGDLRIKSPLDQRVEFFYRCFIKALESQEPLVGYLYGSAFKSANLYDPASKNGKVLSRSVDLQERMEYETYWYLQEHLRALGINFHFIVIRDTFHALSLDLGSPSEKISKNAPEIRQYGEEIHRISREVQVRTLDLQNLMNNLGEPLDCFIDENLESIVSISRTIDASKIAGIKGFLNKEYAYEMGSKSKKEKQAIERAKRYIAMKAFTKEQEASFLIPTLMREFGENVRLIPFSIHVEDYLETCAKVPLRTIRHFLGGCNAQHQLPLLQKKSDGSYKFYTIRSDFLNKLLQIYENKIELINVDSYRTLLYSGDEDIDKIF
ncbi:hypothetical protein QPK87_03350 [Kamptonema cortianum]|nr:hypothetical protein [Geitlerinema splendidum]MDK3155618.1 hypothetical protein [Kamptonema cortianum]